MPYKGSGGRKGGEQTRQGTERLEGEGEGRPDQGNRVGEGHEASQSKGTE